MQKFTPPEKISYYHNNLYKLHKIIFMIKVIKTTVSSCIYMYVLHKAFTLHDQNTSLTKLIHVLYITAFILDLAVLVLQFILMCEFKMREIQIIKLNIYTNQSYIIPVLIIIHCVLELPDKTQYKLHKEIYEYHFINYCKLPVCTEIIFFR